MSTQHKPRIVVLRGGPSEEHALSMQNGAEVLSVLRAEGKVDVIDVVVTKQGDWLENGFVRTPAQVLDRVDGVYIGMHGLYGEDGKVQREIERHGVRYVGSRPFQSSVGLHKMLAKEHLGSDMVRLPRHLRLTKQGISDKHATATMLERLLGPRLIFKPLFGGSGIGTTRAVGGIEILGALEEILANYDEILVEELISGTDVTCGILEGYRGEDLYAAPVVELVFDTAGSDSVFTAEKIVPGRFTKAIKDEIAAAAVKIHKKLELSDLSRSDFVVTPNGDIYFLEVNTLPALTNDSPLLAGLTSVGATQSEIVCHVCGRVL